MIRRRFLMIGCLAAAIGAAASWHVYRSIEAKVAAVHPEVSPVVVAARNIQPGDKIEAKDLRVVVYPSSFLPTGALRNQELVVGRTALLPMVKGEFVLPNKIRRNGNGNSLTEQIPVGMRAVQVPVNEVEAGSIKSGDWVDVLATGNAPGSSDTQTRTVLTNVHLLAAGSRAVTLVVAPEDAEKLTLAIQESRVKIVLRNPADTSQEEIHEVRRSVLYGSDQPRKASLKPTSPAIPEAPRYLEIQVFHGDQPPETLKFKQ